MSRGATVLICDDAEFARGFIREILEEAGYTVVAEAADGADAVRRFDEHRPDLVVMELAMPRLGGLEAIRQMRRLAADARVILCTALDQRPLVAEALEAGARDYLVKPFHAAGLLDSVHRAFR